MKRVLKGMGVATLVLALAMVGIYGWATVSVRASLSRTLTAHEVNIPVPYPLTEEELAVLREERRAALDAEAAPADPGADGHAAHPEGAAPDEGRAEAPQPAGDAVPVVPPVEVDPLVGVDLEALALERAIARGEHLVRARYACGECHGQDFSGGVMVDDPAMGSLLGPNLTPAGPTRDFTMTDWDHIVRHGILADGRPAVMPSEDFVRMSDRELSDIVAYLRAQPAVSNEVGDSALGPIGTLLAALGKLPLSADTIMDDQSAHVVEPPAAQPDAAFGQHLIAVCTGCHRPSLEGSGGPGRSLSRGSHRSGRAGLLHPALQRRGFAGRPSAECTMRGGGRGWCFRSAAKRSQVISLLPPRRSSHRRHARVTSKK